MSAGPRWKHLRVQPASLPAAARARLRPPCSRMMELARGRDDGAGSRTMELPCRTGTLQGTRRGVQERFHTDASPCVAEEAVI